MNAKLNERKLNGLEEQARENQEEVRSLVAKSSEIKIQNQVDYEKAIEFGTGLKNKQDQLKEQRLFFTKPIKDQIKRIENLFRPQEKMIEKAISVIKQSIKNYRWEEEKKRKLEEERIRKEQEKKRKAEERKAKKKNELPPAPQPQAHIPEPEKTTHTISGKMTARKVWTFDIEDIAKVPREYLEVNKRAIREAVRAGERDIPGVRIYQDENIGLS